MKMKQIDVTIMGQTYVLGCPPGGDVALMQAVGTVDREMTTIKEAGRVKARERIAVLAALNLAYALAGRNAEPDPAPVSAAAGPQPAAASSSGPATSSEATSAQDDALIESLLGRLERAIHDDDRLL